MAIDDEPHSSKLINHLEYYKMHGRKATVHVLLFLVSITKDPWVHLLNT